MTCSCLIMGGCQRLVRRALNPRGRIVATVVLAIAVLFAGAVAASAQLPSESNSESVPTQTDLNPPPPLPPLLVTPTDGSDCLDTSLCLSWAATVGAVGYEVQIGTSCGVGPSYSTTDPTYCPPGLLPGTLYYWRVRAKDMFDQWGEWTDCWSLTTLPNLPPPPTHLSPADGVLCQLLDVCFDWEDMAGAVDYEIRIGASCGSGTVYPAATSDYCPPSFVLGTTYFWQVRGRDACGQWGNWSDCWSFATLPEPPSSPTLILPTDGATCQPLSLCLDWVGVPGAVEYEVQIGTGCGIGDEYTSATSELCDPLLAVDTIYFWRVRAKDACDQWGDWSDCLTFTTVPSPPGFALLLAPSDGAPCAGIDACLNWDDVSDAVAYEVQVGTSCGSGTTYGTATSDYCPPGLIHDTTYFWRVRAQEGVCGGWGSWTDCFSFTTSPDLDPPALVEPVNEADCVVLRPCLDWSGVLGAVGYQIHLGSDCDTGTTYDTVDSEYCPDFDLAFETVYYWKVRVQDECGGWSDWSECRWFETVPEELGAPTLATPANDADCVEVDVCLDWDDVTGATGYEVHLGSDCDTGTTYATAGSEYCVDPDLAFETVYFWKVRVQDRCGQWSDWSACRWFETVPEALGAPTLATPANEADCVDVDVCLDWDDVTGAVGYEVHLGPDCDTGTTYATSGSEYCVDPDLAFETVYFWKVRVQDRCGQWSDWSACWWFETVPEALGAPTLATPANEADCVAVDVCLDWDDVTGAVGYEVHLGSDCDTGTTYATAGSGYCVDPDLAYETVYYWKVRVQDRCGQWSDWSECWWFETVPEALGAPTLATPADGANCVAVDVCLDWDDVTGAVGYEVHLGPDCDTGTTYATAGSGYCVDPDLAYETVYYWKVRVQDRCGQWSGWSACWWFETAPEALGAPTLATPANEADCVDVDVCLDWDDVTGATGYEVHLGSDCDTGTTYATSGSEYCVDPDLALGTVYYWKVRAQDRCGQWSDWSACWWFETAPGALDVPLLATPANEADCVPVNECLDWDDVTDAVGYEVHLGSDCDTGTTYGTVNSDYCPASDLAYETVYYWKVRAQDACGRWSDWSECWWFETAPEVPAAPTLLSPSDGAIDQLLDVCVDWDDVPGAVGYEVQLDTDCGFGPTYLTADSFYCPDTDLECETEYFWSVRVEDRCGQWSDWSSCRSFTTEDCCSPPDWSVHPPDFLYTGTITAEVLLDDLPVAGPGDLLAAFFEDECRGVTPAWERPGGGYVFLLTVYSNAASGEILTFKYFDDEECEVHLVCDEIEFVSDMDLCTIPAPCPMDITNVCVSRDFVTGWNWFSLNVHDEDMTLNPVLASIGDNGIYIKDQTTFAEYVLPWGWLGTLETISCSSSYLIQMDAPAVLEFCGCPCDPATAIPLVDEWNWPGYIPQDPMPTDDALASLDDNGVIIKNQTTYAEYVLPWGWIGSLTTMEPLDGFKIYMDNPDNLVYPVVVVARTAPEDVAATGAIQNEAGRLDGWMVNPSEFPANGTVTASVLVDGEPAASTGDMLGAFVGRACRGVTEASMLPNGDSVFFLVVHGDSEETIEFRFFDASENEILDVEEGVVFEADMTLGRALEPYPINVGAAGAGSDDELVPAATALYGNHPNPFRGGTVVKYSLKEAGHVAIEVYNVKGERVRTLVDARREPGAYLVDWDGRDASGIAVSSGVYFCRMVTEGYTTTSRMVLIK